MLYLLWLYFLWLYFLWLYLPWLYLLRLYLLWLYSLWLHLPQERFDSLSSFYCRGARAAIICFDLTVCHRGLEP